jgi:hypothetical protein
MDSVFMIFVLALCRHSGSHLVCTSELREHPAPQKYLDLVIPELQWERLEGATGMHTKIKNC